MRQLEGEELVKSFIMVTTLAALVFCCSSCGKKNETTASLATLAIDQSGIDGSVPINRTRLFTLQGITAGLNYTVRTSIATLGTDTTAPDGTLTVSLYESEAAYNNNRANPVIVLTPNANFPYIYEVNFNAPSSGDYVAAINGISQTIPDSQSFYDLRVMSADPIYLVPFASTMTSTMGAASSLITTLTPGALNVYSGGSVTLLSGGSVTTSGYFPIKIIPDPLSTITSTVAFPQLFVYKDSSLSINSLLYSTYTSTMEFFVTDFVSNPTGTPPITPDSNLNNLSSGLTISNVLFTSATASSSGGPFIVIKGTSASHYYLTVGP